MVEYRGQIANFMGGSQNITVRIDCFSGRDHRITSAGRRCPRAGRIEWGSRKVLLFMIPREFQLLLYCARSLPGAGPIRDLVNKGVNWQRLLQLAQQHGVRPMLFQGLKSVCWNAVPQTTQLELERFDAENVQKNLLFAGELLRLLGVFQQNGVPIVAFKGPVLAETVYGDLSLREFCDLDVIVHEDDVCKVEVILTDCGYQACFPDRAYRSAFLSYHGQYPFRHGKTGILLDLHWRLSSKGVTFPLQLAKVWPRLKQVTIVGRTVPTLADDDLALFLAAHGTKEGWRSLIWLCDFAEFLRKYQEIDWAAVLDRAQRSHSSRSLLLAVALASALLDAPVPSALVDRALRNSAVRALAEKARLRMLRTVPEGELAEFLNGLNTEDRLGQRLRRVAVLLTTRTVGDYKAMPLPKSLWGIYYFTRPFRLARKVAEKILNK
jgi:hypothetical protein